MTVYLFLSLYLIGMFVVAVGLGALFHTQKIAYTQLNGTKILFAVLGWPIFFGMIFFFMLGMLAVEVVRRVMRA